MKVNKSFLLSPLLFPSLPAVTRTSQNPTTHSPNPHPFLHPGLTSLPPPLHLLFDVAALNSSLHAASVPYPLRSGEGRSYTSLAFIPLLTAASIPVAFYSSLFPCYPPVPLPSLLLSFYPSISIRLSPFLLPRPTLRSLLSSFPPLTPLPFIVIPSVYPFQYVSLPLSHPSPQSFLSFPLSPSSVALFPILSFLLVSRLFIFLLPIFVPLFPSLFPVVFLYFASFLPVCRLFILFLFSLILYSSCTTFSAFLFLSTLSLFVSHPLPSEPSSLHSFLYFFFYYFSLLSFPPSSTIPSNFPFISVSFIFICPPFILFFRFHSQLLSLHLFLFPSFCSL